MLTVLTNLSEIETADGEIRAGGTDLHDRYRMGVSDGPIIDIQKLPGLDMIEQAADGTTTIGSLVTIDQVGTHPITAEGYGGLATLSCGRQCA